MNLHHQLCLNYIYDVDVNISSCVQGINAKTCKNLLEIIPERFLKIFGNSLFLGVFPEKWACSTLTFLPKDGDKNDPNNWRPISQTNIFSKILEKFVHIRMLKFLLDNGLVSKSQFGFLPGRSTQQAVFQFVKHLYGSMNNNKIIGSIFLDVAKAFNCIDHSVLYNKMYLAGFSDRVISWFRTYLNRSQIVRLNNIESNIVSVPDGIAQGTVLGPLVFIFYINDVILKLKYVNISMFADDCVLYIAGNNWVSIQEKLQYDLNEFSNWAKENYLALNVSKTKTMIFGNRFKISKIHNPDPLFINGKELDFVKKYTNLELALDCELNLDSMYKDIVKRINNKIYRLRKLRRYISFATSTLIYKQTILPILDYGGFLCFSMTKDRKSDLQVI